MYTSIIEELNKTNWKCHQEKRGKCDYIKINDFNVSIFIEKDVLYLVSLERLPPKIIKTTIIDPSFNIIKFIKESLKKLIP